MSRRRLLYIGLALALVVVGRLLSNRESEPRVEPAPPVARAQDAAATSTPVHLKGPPSAMAELGVLTARPQAELEALLDRERLGASLGPELCGDPGACDAVRATLRDPQATTLQVVASSDWSLERLDVDAAARSLGPRERAGVKALPRVVVVHVTAPASPRQLALRTALAAAASLARDAGGLVWDQLLDRVESPAAFAGHAVTAPLGEPTFRRDRVQVLYQPRGEGVVRVLTGGLSRWGLPDVEAAAVPVGAVERVADVVLGVAEAMARGAPGATFSLGPDDLARASGGERAAPGEPEVAPRVDVAVASVDPEPGDPNDFMARIEPPGGMTPLAYVELAERFFGPLLAASPSGDVLAARQGKAQKALGPALAALARGSGDAGRTRVLVQLPFGIPGEGGLESMWVEVTRATEATVTGRLVDDPLGATDLHRGDEVTRPRAQVEDLDVRGGGSPEGAHDPR